MELSQGLLRSDSCKVKIVLELPPYRWLNNLDDFDFFNTMRLILSKDPIVYP